MKMLPAIYILIWCLFVSVFVLYLFIKYRESQVNQQEEYIKRLFLERTALIPSIYEISREFLNKHDDIFAEILKLRTQEFGEDSRYNILYKILPTKKAIQHEINFLFKVCNKHPKLIQEWKFIYLRDVLMKKSNEISKQLEAYKKSSHDFNKLVSFKNKTVIGYLFPIDEKINL